MLYNIAKARQSAYDQQSVIAVEGYMDTIACSMAGYEHVVAPLGTALTPEQLQLMWRLAKEPILCFDGDEAGKKAAWRAIDTVLPELHPGFSLRFAFLPDGQDPDDLIKSEGQKAFGEVIGAASPLVDVLWQRELKLAPTDTPERRAAFEARLHEQIARINNPAVKTHYDKEVRQRLWELWRARGTSKSAAGSAQRSTPNGSYKAWRKETAPDHRNWWSVSSIKWRLLWTPGARVLWQREPRNKFCRAKLWCLKH